jgi:cyclopropane fatty-acyl-phospholipid synthase-like methyltransferase
MTFNIKKHWETVYETKTQEQVSWTQKIPKDSLDFIQSLKLNKDASIIDIGGGDSFLVDFLLADGYTNISVLDISSKAIERAKDRLGTNATKVTWIVSNIIDFKPEKNYDVWHDRAAFHFLTKENDIKTYVSTTEKYVSKNLIIGTFSNNGPLKCSGLEITQYSKNKMHKTFNSKFEPVKCVIKNHQTPFNTIQNFIFCSFMKRYE